MNANILLIDCQDSVGLIHDITRVLADHGVNIVENDEYVDPETKHFFMRTEFSGSFDSGTMHDDIASLLPEGARFSLTGKRKKNIVIMATKEYHCIGDILVRHAFDDMNAVIHAIISNREKLRPLAEKMDIPFHFVSHENLDRQEHNEKILNVVRGYNPEYIVLAKYMRILTPAFTNEFPNRIINIHHSFLPAFIGASPYKQAHKRGVKIIGATAHFVNQDLDEGPIISQNVIHVNHNYSAEDMARAGRDVEKNVLSNALRLVFEDRVIVSGNKTVVFE